MSEEVHGSAAPDEIDGSWWAAAAAAFGDAAGVTQPELWFFELDAAAHQAFPDSLQERVLTAMATSASAMLVPDKIADPFEPAIRLEGRRSLVPADLTDDQIALLSRVAPMVEHATLRARIADVCWTYGDRGRVDLLQLAVDAYRAVPLEAEHWFSVGEDSWKRALELILRRGAAERDRATAMTEDLSHRLLESTNADAFMTVKLSELLRALRTNQRPEPRAISDHLAHLATQAAGRNRRLSRHLEDEVRAWSMLADDHDGAWAAQVRIAESNVAEAVERLAADRSGAFVAAHHYEEAIARLTSIPRTRRDAMGVDERVAELRRELSTTRRLSLDQMTAFESEPIDLSSATEQARNYVSGHDWFMAIARYAMVSPLIDLDAATAAARQRLEGSLSRLFTQVTLAGDGRKVAVSGGSAVEDADLDAALVRDFGIRVEMTVAGVLLPALEVLQSEHRFSLDRMRRICLDSPVIPPTHVDLWTRGLYHGVNGDFPSSISLLVPQLEHLVRTQMQAADIYTLVVDRDTGVESEKGLGALLGLPEAEVLLGHALAFELRALLVEQRGANLRNQVAHGLLNDGQAWSSYALYAWWVALRLAVIPVWRSIVRPDDETAPETDGTPDKNGQQDDLSTDN